MHCPDCDATYPDHAHFCMLCGAPLRTSPARSAAGPDERVLRVELGLGYFELLEAGTDEQRRAEALVAAALANAARAGWMPAEPTDLTSLLGNGRLELRPGFVSGVVDSLGILLRRVAP